MARMSEDPAQRIVLPHVGDTGLDGHVARARVLAAGERYAEVAGMADRWRHAFPRQDRTTLSRDPDVARADETAALYGGTVGDILGWSTAELAAMDRHATDAIAEFSWSAEGMRLGTEEVPGKVPATVLTDEVPVRIRNAHRLSWWGSIRRRVRRAPAVLGRVLAAIWAAVWESLISLAWFAVTVVLTGMSLYVGDLAVDAVRLDLGDLLLLATALVGLFNVHAMIVRREQGKED